MAGNAETLRYDGQVALVTGAGRGLGRAYAIQLAARGAKVVVNDLAGEPGTSGATVADTTVSEIASAGGQAVSDIHDVADAPEAVVAAATENWGRLDLVITNAADPGETSVGALETPHEVWRRILDVNVYGAAGIIQHAWPALAEHGGRVITVSSTTVLGHATPPGYATTKAALIGLTRSLARLGAAAGIRVNAIMPAAYTGMLARIPDQAFVDSMREHFRPEQVAEFVVWLGHESVQVNGEIFTVGGGRAARLFLGVTPGWGSREASAEDFRDHSSEVLNIDGFTVPEGTSDEVRWAARQLGVDLADSAFLRL